MKRSTTIAVGVVTAAALALAGCGGGDDAAAPADGPVTLTLAGWSLSTTPEFQTLADAYHEVDPDVTIEVQEYDATNYDTQMTTDLAAGTAPDLYVQKNLKNFYTYQSGAQLADLSEVASTYDDSTAGLDFYAVDDGTYAIPYRQDAWYVYYNKDLFAQAGVPEPTGEWTWDDYAQTALDLQAGLDAAGSDAHGAYQHTWQSTVQGFALAQTPGADLASGDYSYMEPYYERSLRLQDEGAQVGFGTATTSSLTYQTEFGTQQAAMMPMGSWYVATLLAQQESGEADEFSWGIAPAPQYDDSTFDAPVTFADPTGIGLNPAVDDAKRAAAEDFLAFVGGEEAALALAEIGITPAYTSDAVTEAFFGLEGVPTDDLSRFTFAESEARPENPVSVSTTVVQNILGEAHTEIMSESSPVDPVLEEAGSRVESEAPTS
ncbi:extracellular solute-binding protein [Pseudokineococcus marinus]|uniref:Extracellular solute-binding protein n=1 Tax=Pseudokineococcus marinus TaxID=351215 RepID=A0A849BKM0_9ACTN|nr:extracellular solute-binding protein [Pseudokineococcus marinus]NNH23161.1 extracellular solute-binding protein [Pseudokineococcus marinus]